MGGGDEPWGIEGGGAPSPAPAGDMRSVATGMLLPAKTGRAHARDVSISSANSGRCRPHRDVKTTRGGDSHFGSPAIHTAAMRCPPRSQRLAASRPGRRLPNGPLWPWPERPPSPRARYGFGARWKFTPRPCPPGVAPAPSIPAGRPPETPLCDGGGSTNPLPCWHRCPNGLAPVPYARLRTRGRWPRPPTRPWPRHRAPRLPLRSASVWVSPPVHGDRRRFERRHGEERLTMNHPMGPLVRRSRTSESCCLNRWSTWTLVSPVCAALKRSWRSC